MTATRIKTSYIPQAEGNFNAFARQFVRQVAENPEEYELSSERVKALQNQLAEWDKKYAAAVKARDAAKAATESKDEARQQLEETVRSVAKLIQANDEVSNAARDRAGLPIHKTTRTPVAVPHTFPTGTVIGTDRLELTLMYSDVATPTRKAKPYGVRGCEVYVAIADNPPANPEDYRFVAFSTRSPEPIAFKSDDGGKTANILLRWVNTKGEAGPWSQVASATIPAV